MKIVKLQQSNEQNKVVPHILIAYKRGRIWWLLSTEDSNSSISITQRELTWFYDGMHNATMGQCKYNRLMITLKLNKTVNNTSNEFRIHSATKIGKIRYISFDF